LHDIKSNQVNHKAVYTNCIESYLWHVKCVTYLLRSNWDEVFLEVIEKVLMTCMPRSVLKVFETGVYDEIEEVGWSFEELDSKSRTRKTAVGIEYVRDVARRTRLQWFVWSYEKRMSQLNKYLD
jgi:hypothetical protein